MAGDGRLAKCSLCAVLFVVCRGCDRGQQYCSKEHAKTARRKLQREAGRRYQRTPKGQLKNRQRQARYRARQWSRKLDQDCDDEKPVTHQSSLIEGRQTKVMSWITTNSSSSDGNNNGVTCAICGDSIQESWLRPDFCRRQSKWYRKFGHDWARKAGRDRKTSRSGGLAARNNRPPPRDSS